MTFYQNIIPKFERTKKKKRKKKDNGTAHNKSGLQALIGLLGFMAYQPL